MRRKQWMAYGMLLILVMNLTGCGNTAVQAEESIIKPVKIMHVDKEIYKDILEVSGNVKPGKTIRLAFKVPGVIENIYIEEGDVLQAGQRIMSLQDSDYMLNVTAAQAQYDALALKSDSSITSAINQAKANLDFIQTQYERVNRLYEKGAVPKKTLEELEVSMVVAENKYQEAQDASAISDAQLRQAEAALELAQSKLQDTVLLSPSYGTVVKKLVETGESIAAGYPAIVLGQLDILEVEIGVTDKYVGKLKKGQEVDLQIYGLEKAIKGKISNIDATADAETRTFGVKIEINNKDRTIKPGMIARANIVLGQSETMLIPVDTVIKHHDKAVVYIYHEEGNRVEERKVEIGKVIGKRIEITEGIHPGEMVVVEGQYILKENDRVKAEVVE
ncbi:efflux RND transporter periplasmic adaptor subunit [Geosporobacter ferrireducens]|uniref:efflux RND transporter periplasmic adaptor subunit n=1 Tax=Geosporobacter ferrireducens TaxID=1424294 RepID=UPI00139BCE0E|nr:efflux RND transporter periplasmic adaptor subunit [Geosporobacter ferrireducens]MTI53311.1 efflux RND transporter periplasmic adaptor subunit [Geosporobacter ferrireducens]